MRLRAKIDLVFVLALFCGGFAWSAITLKPETFPDFYQGTFGPAVMRALGYGFVNPVDKAAIPGLRELVRCTVS
jgi:hypothetical protein